MNDAVSMVFYDAVVEMSNPDHHGGLGSSVFSFFFILISSTFVGLIVGLITAFILKKISEFKMDFVKIEVAVMVIIPWMSYLSSFICNISSIVVIFFVGVSQAIYTKPNLSSEAKHVRNEF